MLLLTHIAGVIGTTVTFGPPTRAVTACCTCDDASPHPSQRCSNIDCGRNYDFCMYNYCQTTKQYIHGAWVSKRECSDGDTCRANWYTTLSEPSCLNNTTPRDGATCHYCCHSPDRHQPMYCRQNSETKFIRFSTTPSTTSTTTKPSTTTMTTSTPTTPISTAASTTATPMLQNNGTNGPKCRSCDFVWRVEDCHHVTQCRLGEQCFVQKFKAFGLTRYRMGCISNEGCGSRGNVNTGVPIVGKRSLETAGDCTLCCTKDHCNAIACQNSSQDLGISPLRPLADGSNCSDSTSDCDTFGYLDENACRNSRVVDLCPASCKTCGFIGWSAWEAWGTCSSTCGEGTRVRQRRCVHQLKAVSDPRCTGDARQSSKCHQQQCQSSTTPTPTSTTDHCKDQIPTCHFYAVQDICYGLNKAYCLRYCRLCWTVDEGVPVSKT